MLGQLVVQYARTSGAATIIAVDTAPARLELASRHGATHTLELPVDQAREPIEQITGGELAHVVFDMTGAAPVQAHCHHLLRHFGRLVLIGDTGTPERQGLSSAFMLKNLRIIGAHQLGAAHEPYWKHRQLGELFLTLLTQGRLNVRDLITHRYPAAQAGEAYDMLLTRRGDAMGVILDFNDV
ncbi:MAG: zinc-binding dehydrogenase [Phycisphaeraceae bacterium]